ncbi:MAG: nucleoside deaminase [Candidatus Omnitrophica bacterium]|nr:nucleoside deaminase [Candidatus Omnitrophota bacterium]
MKKDKDSEFMKIAIKEAKKNLKKPAGGPFGACIVKNNKVLARTRNTVFESDATCHAEINAIRKASRKLKSFDLSKCTIYSTAEPCPMCFSAIHWARIKRVVFGAGISDAKKTGFRELDISNKKIKAIAGLKIRIDSGIMKEQCRGLLEAYKTKGKKFIY